MSAQSELQKHLLNLKLSNKTLTGILHNNNKGAADWGWQGMLAYGCQTSVVIVDTRTVQVLQTLERHRAIVVKVKWARQNYHHDERSPYTLRLASADAHGRIVVWDVSQAVHRVEFQDGTKPILEMDWLSTQDASHDLLVALHPPYSIILWNADTGTKLWKKSFTDIILSFSFDPFNPTSLTLLGQDCILFVNDFSVSKPPSSNGKKFYIESTPSASSSGGATSDRRGSARTAFKRVKMLVGEGKPSAESVSLNECLQMTYLQSSRHHLLLLYSREVLIVDLEINQTVGVIPMERSGSPFLQIIPCRQRDVLMCLHENGSISVRVRRRSGMPSLMSAATTPVDQIGNFGDSTSLSSFGESIQDVVYDLRCQSDHLRVTKHVRPFGIYSCPCTERSVALIMNDGRVMIWSLKTTEYVPHTNNSHIPSLTPLHSPGYSSSNGSFEFLPAVKDKDEVKPKMEVKMKTPVAVLYPKMCLSDLIGQVQFHCGDQMQQGRGVVLKFVLVGLLNGVAAPPLVIRMCPPLTTKNYNVYQPLVALGNSAGLIQVYNLSSGLLWREYNIHLTQIRGIEWVSLNSFLSYAYPNPTNSGTVRNELILTDMQTGRTTTFRGDKNEESPIEMLRVSHLKQYFIIVFKEKPFELWDLRTGTLLREMPKNFPIITALEWSPSSNLKSLKKKLAQDVGSSTSSTTQLSASESTTGNSSVPMPDTSSRSERKGSHPLNVKEHFVFTDTNGLLYHFFVEGNIIKDGAKIPPESGMGSVTCIAWKGDTIVLGDVDGNLSIWDLKARVSRAVPTHRGWIKKIKFAPGKGNHKLLVLYNDGMDVWDTKDVEQVSNLRSPREIAKVTDVEWATSDKPILATNDGCFRVFDINLKVCSSPLEDLSISDPVFCPHLLPSKAALNMKYLLQHQPWNTEYQLHLDTLDLPDGDAIVAMVNEQIKVMPAEVRNFLPYCSNGVAQRCLLTARLFGDESESNFWTVAMYYLRMEQARQACLIHKSPTSNDDQRTKYHVWSKHAHESLPQQEPASDVFLPRDSSHQDLLGLDKPGSVRVCDCLSEAPLDMCYDVLCDNQSYQRYQLERVNLHDNKRTTYEHTKKCAENFMLLNQTDRAVQLYLETDSDNECYYEDSLRACLVATIRSSGASQSTIKLVATSLIANGKLSEGVQLLCLIDKGLDACRYLQTYGRWQTAVWLAKATLGYSECCEVLKRWADHLCQPEVNQKSKAVLVMISLGLFHKALEILYSMHYFDRAALFAEACADFGLLPETEETKKLIAAIYLEYAHILSNLGNKQAAAYYCQKSAEKGEQLQQELEWM
ncbi:WD repeat-containing protein 11-like isoform X2 [Glandiceps talaboti]